MSKRLALILTAAMLTGLFSGCTSNTAPGEQQSIFSKQNIGAVAGAVGGGVLGSQFGKGSGKTAMTIVGALAGAGLGGYIGNQMDENDRLRANQSLETMPDNRATTWRNPNTGQGYTVTPTKTYQADSGQYCREYSTTAYIDGKEQTVYGRACRQPDGTWQQQQ